jgi:hypothetical protein
MHTSPPARKNLPNRRARGRGRKGSGRDDRSCQRRARARRPTRTHPPGQATTPHRRRPATGRADQDCPYVCDLTAGGDRARQEQEPAPCTSTTNCPKKLSFVNPGRPSAPIDHSWDDHAACMRSVVAVPGLGGVARVPAPGRSNPLHPRRRAFADLSVSGSAAGRVCTSDLSRIRTLLMIIICMLRRRA